MHIKYLLYINAYSLRNLYAPIYYLFVFVLFLFLFLAGDRVGRLDIKYVYVVYKCIFLVKLPYTQLLFVCFFIIIFLGGYLGGGGEDEQFIKYLLYVNIHIMRVFNTFYSLTYLFQ